MKLQTLRRHSKPLATILLLIFATTLIPTRSYAITSGPAQEEFASFSPAGSTDMVNLYTGDFNYNIPLMTVPGPNGGYPINLSYSGGTDMNDPGSWVGTGWDLNIGAINRQMRGLPDDFSGAEKVRQEMSLKKSFSVGLEIPTQPSYDEVAGFPVPPTPPATTSPWTAQLYYNNYKGLGYKLGIKGPLSSSFSAGVSYDSQEGIGVDLQLGTSQESKFAELGLGLDLATSFNSRRGLQGLTYSTQFTSSNETSSSKEGVQSSGISLGSPLTFGFNGSIPEVSIPTKTTSIDFDIKYGTEVNPGFWFQVGRWGKWAGSFEWSKVKEGGVVLSPAFGYLHTHLAENNSKGLKDFNRDQLPYSKKIPNLAPSFYTYDILSVSGEGVGGTYRPYRTEAEALNTPSQSNEIDGHRVNLEFGAGGLFHIGLGYGHTKGETYSGPWKTMATLEPTPVSQSLLDPCGDPDCDTNNKAAKYKLYGEQSGRTNSDNSQLSVWDNKKAVRVALTKNTVSPKAFTANGGFAPPANINTSATFYAKRPKEPQANTIQTLNALQSYRYGFGKRFATHTDCNNCSGDLAFWDSTGVKRYKVPTGTLNSQGIDKSEKVSEIIVTKNDGMRYVYGLPAMNQRQVNASFNVYPNGSGTGNAGKYTGGATPAVSSNVLNPDVISTGTNAVATHSSSNQYLNKTTLPKYAHSWLLTHVVSPDYSDRTGNGFSIDDPGSWMKFEYKKTASHYRWREPYVGLSFMQGNKADQRDDMAAYTFGTKELYYLHRIETATHLAVFETEDRNDGVEAKSELFGGLNNNTTPSPRKMQRLKSIKLYVKPLDGTTLNIATATPIQTVVFGHAGYDNYPGTTTAIPASLELCKGIPSAGGSNRGKLTLVTVHMTADKSIKGSLSPYKFTYATNTALVEGYNRLNKDRWGNFQYNSGLFGSWFSYVDFPYTTQVVGQQYANNWQLTQIQLPTGGFIDVTYESDDYAYEMDKPAAQMFDIIHTSTETTAPTTTTWTSLPTTNDRYASPATLASGNLGGTASQNTYRIYVKLPRPIPSTVTDKNKYFKDNYLGKLSKVYFKTLCQLKNGSSKSERDYVAGYADLETTAANSYGVSSDGTLAFITLKGVDVQNPAFGQKIHPIRKASLEHLRANKPELVYGYNTAEGSPNNFKAQFKNIVGSIGNFFQEVSLMFGGFNRQAVASPRQWSNTIYFNGNSMVRLQSGEGAMYGGGIRVSKIAIRNQWDVIGGGVEDSYGQQYEYKIEENGRMISSGVAMTPPDMGGDECALLEPVNYTNSTPLVSPFHLFVEKPIMRDYYPGASVGYRKVTVKGLASSTPTPAKDLSYAPITEHEFYTPKDFPVFESQTDLSGDQPIYEMANFIIGTKMIKKTGRSQGYTVELNNMAGVMKSVTKRTYPTTANPNGTVISKIEHIYHTDPVYPDRLSSNVAIMKNNESMEMGVIGETYDIFHDFHENLQTARQVGLDLNVDIMSIFLPILTILPIPGFSQNTSSVRTAVTHKIIYRTGILKEVRATDGLSTVVTENLAFDKVTAQPVLTRVTNEFKDYIYSYSQPAYWYYNSPTTGSMAGAWENIGVTGINTGAATAGVISGIALADISNFVVGDEIWVNDPADADAGFRAIVTQVGASSITCMRPQRLVANDATSIYPTWTGARVLTIFRSGRRNLLDAVAGNTSFRGAAGATDFAQIVGQFNNRNSNVLDVSTTTFKDAWDADYCNTYYTCQILPSAAPTTLCTPSLEPGCQAQVQVPQPANPYVTGSKGNWRVHESFANKSKRTYMPDASEGSKPSLREYGTFSILSPFTWSGTNGAPWVRASKVIRYLLQGASIEEQDAIGNSSATQFGYKRQLVTATCTNSEYREMAFDGFEDYPKDCSDHFKISYISPDNIVSSTAHTGSKSIRVTNRDVGGTTSDYPYIIKSLAAPGAGCINSFSPIAATTAPLRKYAISAWVKERLATNESQDIANARHYSKAAIKVSFTTLSGSNVGTFQTFKPFGELVEGWQRINGSFEVPIGAELIHIRLLNTSTGNVNTVFMDDIRIHPFNALMQSFVYDPTNLRLLATLDENNYATFYIRDQEGQPVKFNKETEKGIVTVKEGTKHVKQ